MSSVQNDVKKNRRDPASLWAPCRKVCCLWCLRRHIWISLQLHCICFVHIFIYTHKWRLQCWRNIIIFQRNPNRSGEKSWIAHFAAGCPQRSWVMSKKIFTSSCTLHIWNYSRYMTHLLEGPNQPRQLTSTSHNSPTIGPKYCDL